MFVKECIKNLHAYTIRRGSVFRLSAKSSLVGCALVLAATAPSAYSQVVYVAPPPAPAYEVPPPPPPRPYYIWRPGHWAWDHSQYVWEPAAWVPVGVPNVDPQPYTARAPQVERLSTDALFKFDRGDVADITPAGINDLDQIAARLRAGNFDSVEIRGYTDRLGSAQYNIRLSERRAEAVKAVLVQQGVPAEKIRTVGLGEQDPIVQCKEPDGPSAIRCLQPNRRVEIVTNVTERPRRLGDNGNADPRGYYPGQAAPYDERPGADSQ